MGDDGIYKDDVEDECTTTCGQCGGVFQLQCVSVDVEMEATKSAVRTMESVDRSGASGLLCGDLESVKSPAGPSPNQTTHWRNA